MIKDVPKTLVYDLCRYRNAQAVLEGCPGPSPTACSTRRRRPSCGPTSATTSRSRPTRSSTRSSQGYVEGDRTAADLVAEGFDPAVVDRVVGLVDRAEYKRRQMPPGVRITTKAFGKDRRMPITNRYRSLGARGAAPGRPTRRPTGAGAAPTLAIASTSWRGWRALLLGSEHRIFELTGGSGGRPGRRRCREADAELRVLLDAPASRRHGGSAERWAERLPGAGRRRPGRARHRRRPGPVGRRRSRTLVVRRPGRAVAACRAPWSAAVLPAGLRDGPTAGTWRDGVAGQRGAPVMRRSWRVEARRESGGGDRGACTGRPVATPRRRSASGPRIGLEELGGLDPNGAWGDGRQRFPWCTAS